MTGAQCGDSASNFSLPTRGMIIGGTWSNVQLMGWPRALQMARPLHRAHDRTHGAAVRDHAAVGRRSQMALSLIPPAETSWSGPRTPVAGLVTQLACGGAPTDNNDG